MNERDKGEPCPLPWSDLVSSILSRSSVLWGDVSRGRILAGLWLCVAVQPITLAQVLSPAFLALAVWQPILEELFFRGYCQGQLRRQSWGRQSWRGLTVANSLTSLLFVVGHWWAHPPLWAIAVLLPRSSWAIAETATLVYIRV